MFEEVAGIPAHPLLLHAAVVFVPLLALLAVGYALVPFIRAHTRWVLAVLAVVTPIAALVTKLSGDAFLNRMDTAGRITESFRPVIEEHEQLGNLTLLASIVLALATLALVYLVGPRAAAAHGAAAAGARGNGLLVLVVKGLVVVAAGVSLYFVVRAGDSGAKAVWTGY
ncbi:MULTISPECIES: hypothetical protein [unclassified Solwaraspora]|uniref:hypothetical protein n=1 Tax=unclassified Solwaraspora TaxID=2627926 RepID=UPI00248B931D|nr:MULTISPECIES: hypothetical protein [unclassified Solwaraspora]WBB99995.1 hypothetical protein O7553_14435 [Solwaraspora sp. WMMA2059]WBC21458.1 hypothetical protein O7543_02935 [Solwaraspora sp. WMMA2080]WJK36462.1 hypothetical protein O7610_08975 [Solwaraspora sp. WMMA2065]